MINQSNQVEIIGVLHGFHKESVVCSYQHIFDFVQQYNPEVLCIEIRAEDLHKEDGYLERIYPFEMVELKRRYVDQIEVIGVDWLGTDIEGIEVPENYFKELPVKILEKRFESDVEMASERSLLQIIDGYRYQCISSRSLGEINDGKYDVLCRVYYKQLNQLLAHTTYSQMVTSYEIRDEKIAQNVSDVIAQNQGKRILIVVGLDHKSYLLEHFQASLV